MRPFARQLRPALLVLLVFTVVCGVVYPLLTTLIGQVAFADRADGSLIRRDGVAIGSELIGQAFVAPESSIPVPRRRAPDTTAPPARARTSAR